MRLRVNALSTQNVQINSDSLIVAIELWIWNQFNFLGESFFVGLRRLGGGVTTCFK
jgi:hypothetical protein